MPVSAKSYGRKLHVLLLYFTNMLIRLCRTTMFMVLSVVSCLIYFCSNLRKMLINKKLCYIVELVHNQDNKNK